MSTNLSFQCRASNRLGSQSFDIRLENELQVGTPIRQNLVDTHFKETNLYSLNEVCVWHRQHILLKNRERVIKYSNWESSTFKWQSWAPGWTILRKYYFRCTNKTT